ncbi:MAG: hypothetical protein IH845_01450 [Nanoarchaeota archaeon]|nr:hypothetical protein [Nanoarchaeota archaeon]
MRKIKSVRKISTEVFDEGYFEEFDKCLNGVKGLREKFILATGEVEKEVEEVISIVLFGRDRNRMSLFKDTIINREFFTLDIKFDILTEIIAKGEIEFEKSELDSFLNQIREVIRMKKLFLKGDIVISESSVRIHLIEKKMKIGRIIDMDFFNEVNELISRSVLLLKELGEFVEDVGENSEEILEDVKKFEDESDLEDEGEDDGFKVSESDIWESETGMKDEYTKDTSLDEIPDVANEGNDE